MPGGGVLAQIAIQNLIFTSQNGASPVPSHRYLSTFGATNQNEIDFDT